MPVVELDGVGEIEFPDEMSQEDIGAALGKQFGKPRITRGITPTPTRILKPETAEDVSRRLARPGVKLPDGSMGSVRSISVGDERGEWVIPTIVDAKPVSNDEAIRLWRQGKNDSIGGPFKTTKEADDYSWQFHLAEEKRGRLPDFDSLEPIKPEPVAATVGPGAYMAPAAGGLFGPMRTMAGILGRGFDRVAAGGLELGRQALIYQGLMEPPGPRMEFPAPRRPGEPLSEQQTVAMLRPPIPGEVEAETSERARIKPGQELWPTTSREPSDLERLRAQMSTPGNLVMLGVGATKLGARLMLPVFLAALPDQIREVVKDVIGSDATPEEKRDRVNALVVPLGIGLHATKPKVSTADIREWEKPIGPMMEGRLLRTPRGAEPSSAAQAVGAVGERGVGVEGEPTTALTPEAEAALQEALGQKPGPPPEPPPPAPQAVPKPPAPAPPAPGAAAAKPEVATLGTDTVKPNRFGDPGGTTYYATPGDWAEWQSLSARDLMEEGVWPAREALKNKYGGNPPKPPKEGAPATGPFQPGEALTVRDPASGQERKGVYRAAGEGGRAVVEINGVETAFPEGWLRREGGAPEPPAETSVTGLTAEAGPGMVGKAVSALESQADKARARIAARQRNVKFGAGPLHELPNAADYALVGAAKLARFGLDKVRWVAEMVREFGERIRPHLDRLYDDARAALTRSARIARAQETPVQDIIRQAVTIAPARPEAATQVIDTMQSSIRTARALRDHFTDAPKVSRAEAKAADDWLEADANRIRDSLTELVRATLPVSERGRFITAINKATKRSPILTGDPEAMYRRAASVAARIEERGVEAKKAGVANEIKAAVTKAMDSPGVDIGYKQRILATVQRLAFAKPTAATARALKATRDYLARMEAAGQDVDMPKDVLDSLDVLHQIPAGELPLHVLEALRDKVNQLADLGRMKVKARKQVWEIEKNAKIRELNRERTNPMQERPEMRQQPGDPRPLSTRIRNFINRRLNAGALADKAILPIDAIFDLLGDAKGTYRGWLFRHFRNPMDLDFNAAQVMRDRLTAPVDAIIKKFKLGQAQAERIGVFAATMQEGGMDRLIEMGVKPETIDHVLKTITPAETQAYQAMRASMEATFPEVQKLMHDLYNIAVSKEDNYFPMPRDWNQYDPGPPPPKAPKFGSDIDLDELAGWKAMLGDYTSPKTTKTERGFTITRKPGAETPIKLNAFDVFYRHINDVSYLLKTQRDLKMMGEMVRSDLFPAKYGKTGQNVVLSWLDTVARQGQVSPLQRWHFLDELRRNTTVGVIGYRIASQFVHASNIPLAMWRAGGPEWWRSGLAESLGERGDKFMRENFAETFTRGGAEPALVEASERDVTAFGRTIVPKKIIRAGFAIARAIDRYNAQATAMGAYLRLLSKKGLDWRHYDQIPVDKESQARALVLTRRAVASPLFKDVSPSLSRGALTGGNVSVGRSLMQFQNVFQDQWSNIRHDMLRAGIREKNPRLAATAFVALTAVGLAEMGIRTTVKSGIASATGYTPKKEEGAEEKMIKEAVRRLPFGGQLTGIIMNQSTGVPIIDSIRDVGVSAKSAVTAQKPGPQDKAKIRAASAVLQLMGVPGASQVGELIEKSY